ncbi:hypothetical protein I5J74_17805 [Pseudomonas aeruginosa]|nr:hypothetical protein [Pseudomonas aeruginosa]MBH8838937.1 hypothetical protein [Pseudomonas aeruginosa]
MLTAGTLTQQAMRRGILIAGALARLLHRLGGLSGALLAGMAQRGDLPALLRYCGLQAPTSGTAGGQIRLRGIELRTIVPRAEPDTAGGAETN